ncbi:hypothetical protein H311_02338 [Anncaliia algerae PRA109]|nr:hypothetical protein H311_02338 [Anncaliia algerae PRA109]
MDPFSLFNIISLAKIFCYMMHIKATISYYNNHGIFTPIMIDYDMYLNIFFMFTGYIFMLNSYLTYSYYHILLYLVFVVNTLVNILAKFPFVNFTKYFTTFICIAAIEPFFVIYNLKSFAYRAIYTRNKKLGSNILLKNGLNVSKMLIWLDI